MARVRFSQGVKQIRGTAADNLLDLKSYVGFFGILWFTWLQVALFDVRFSNDSAWERLCKALQFGIMTGFAVVGPGYKTGWEPNTKEAFTALNSFKTLTLILMASRLILAGQYSAVMVSLRGYKKAWLPILAHIGTLFVAAMIYLGLYFSFSPSSSDNGLIAWYVCIGFEAIVIFLVSGKTKFLSFRRTAIVERLGLLTLIILGEGIIGMCGSIRRVGSDKIFNPDVIGMIICSVGIICKPPFAVSRKRSGSLLMQTFCGCCISTRPSRSVLGPCASKSGQFFISLSTSVCSLLSRVSADSRSGGRSSISSCPSRKISRTSVKMPIFQRLSPT